GLHLSGTAWASDANPILGAAETSTGIEVTVADASGKVSYLLERETMLPIALQIGDVLVNLRFVPSGDRQLFSHVDYINAGKLVAQGDLTYAANGPYPTDIVRRESTNVFTAHLSDFVVVDEKPPFLASPGSSGAP